MPALLEGRRLHYFASMGAQKPETAVTMARETMAMFSVGVQFSKIPDADSLNAELKDEIARIQGVVPNSLPQGWSCHVYTTIQSDLNLFDRPVFKKLAGLIMTEAEAFAASYNLDFKKFPLRINECWVNVYGQGDAQDVHLHRNSVISGIYYVAAPPNCGELLFHSPVGDMMLEPPITQGNIYNAPIRNVIPSAGTMVLFRSWLRHSVKPTRGKEERISVAFNLTM